MDARNRFRVGGVGQRRPGRLRPRGAAHPRDVHTLVAIDPAVAERDTLLAFLRPGVRAMILHPTASPACQIADAAAGLAGLRAVHVVAHGQPGRVMFAGAVWSRQTLGPAGADLARIGAALEPGGELVLWCCEAARGHAGRAFVAALAAAAGVEVRATDRVVGAATLGGTWFMRGPMPAAAAAVQPPFLPRGLAQFAGRLGPATRIVSGDVPSDPAENVPYSVVTAGERHVVAQFSLPGRSGIPRFAIAVTVPDGDAAYEVGRFNAAGDFIPADFAITHSRPSIAGGSHV